VFFDAGRRTRTMICFMSGIDSLAVANGTDVDAEGKLNTGKTKDDVYAFIEDPDMERPCQISSLVTRHCSSARSF
jgi:hypothetical protein